MVENAINIIVIIITIFFWKQFYVGMSLGMQEAEPEAQLLCCWFIRSGDGSSSGSMRE